MARNIIDLSLKSVYLEPIRQGVKTVEYRDNRDYYMQKLVDVEAYGGKSIADIRIGLIDGTLELIPRPITHIMFHESGSQRTLLVEVEKINYYQGHYYFCIGLGKVITNNDKEE